MIHGIQHTAISTPDMERALRFYRDLIGFEIESDSTLDSDATVDSILGLRDAKCRIVMLGLGESRVELFEFAAPKPELQDPDRPVCNHGITHLCLKVSDIESEHKRLAAAGMRFHCPPVTFGGGSSATYGRDPDGNVVELLEIR